MKKITKSTLKSFLRKNEGSLFIKTISEFDGMTDGIEDCRNAEFKPLLKISENDTLRSFNDRNLGYRGITLTFSTRNWMEEYNDSIFKGIRVDNCVGSFIVAVKKEAQ